MDNQNLTVVETESPEKPVSRGFLRQQMRRALFFLPNLVKLAYRLMLDARVSKADKLIMAAAIIYVIVPIDLIPDFIPFIGQVDDSYLIAVALLRLFNHTDEEVIRAHWDGGGDIHRLLVRTANLATYFLPKRIQRALVGRIDLPDSVADFSTYAAKRRSS